MVEKVGRGLMWVMRTSVTREWSERGLHEGYEDFSNGEME